MRVRSLCDAAALLLVTTTVLVACKAEITRHVLIVGDSLTQGAMGPTHVELNQVGESEAKGRYIASYDAINAIGARVVPGVADAENYWEVHLASLVEHVDPEVWVIALGTNDCINNRFAEYGAAVDFFLSRIPADKPVFWPTLTLQKPSHQQCVAEINSALQDATARWPNLTVFDLRSKMTDPAFFQSDQTHFSSSGNLEYARQLHVMLDDAFVVPTTTTTTTTTTAEPTTTTTETTAAP
jgi:lysophospholipase L1-like esterase